MTVEPPYTGFYHPDCSIIPADMDEYMAWYGSYAKPLGKSLTQPRAGVFFSRHQVARNHLTGINALTRELESMDIIPVPLFSQQKEHAGVDCPGYNVDLAQLKGVDVVINCVSSFLFQTDMTAGNPQTVLNLIDAPVFQAVASTGRTEEEWRHDPQGITAMNQVYWVSQPEFNGTIEPTVLFAKGEDEHTAPILDRITFFVRRIKNWLDLKAMPKKDRNVTILLHNNPCAGTEASLGGASGLDSFESVVRLMRYLADQGYTVDAIPENAKALSDEFLNRKAISEFRWTTVDEIVDKGGAAVFIDPETYERYFNALSPENRKNMIENWGEPPGQSMVYKGDMVVTGLTFGNIRVMAEPKRGCYGSRCDGQVCKILHNPEIPPTHQCYATFKWIQEQSDLIISTGTHGYIEFLPGKSCGMSADCFPEIITGDVPHLYIYTSKNPNEAILAKRRASAVITDHLIPIMQSADLYDELGDLDDLLAQYTNAAMLGEQGRKKQLAAEIRDLVAQLNLLPLNDNKAASLSDAALIEKVHDKLFLLRDSNINDGLHVLSDIRDLDSMVRMILSILKYDGNVPSIRRCILELTGQDYDALVNCPENARILDDCREKAFSLIKQVLAGQPVDQGLVAREFPALSLDRSAVNRLLVLLRWVRDTLYPDLMKTRQEIPLIEQAMDKHYVSPGPGGTLTRGKTDVLPTGRNIYSIDPRKIPTRAAHVVGVKLADEILSKHLGEFGTYPEKIGMVFWSLDAYRADGEQLAQILHLMGARPAWNESGIVTGVEIIPLDELKRPRIDVTIRTSEIVRDTLPNLVELMDEAVVMIAALDEDESDNYIRKNALTYKRNALKNGVALDEKALDRASTLRLFAARPGTYGNGIKLMIAASAWTSIKDLGETFIEHGGYAYGKGVFGRESHQEFAHNLKNISTVFHKMETDETDPLGCCYNDFQGGMTAAVRALSNMTPKVLWGDTKDPANPKVRELREEIERVVRVKLLNPQWIEGMKRHGYKGAQGMAHKAASVYGWDATSDVVDDWIFDELTKKYVLDPEMRAFYKENNPWALEELARRFLEAEQRGLWNADPEVLSELREDYLEIEGWIEETMGDVNGEFQGGSVDILTKNDVKEWDGRLRFNIDAYLRVP